LAYQRIERREQVTLVSPSTQLQEDASPSKAMKVCLIPKEKIYV